MRRRGQFGVVLLALLLSACSGPVPSAAQISWQQCDPAGGDVDKQLHDVGARCGTYRVPLDYASPATGSIDIAVAFRPATDRANRLGTLLVETGGPGPSRDGVLVATAGTEGLGPLPEFVAQRYDLVAIDPRFFGASSPHECRWRTDTYLTRVAQAAPVSDAALADSEDAARGLARQCAPFADELRHASTRNIARDIDRLRQRLDVDKISYLGWSYGTYLGAVYAEMFGNRIDRMVLDSALDPDAYGPEVTRATASATAAALDHWARWASRRDDTMHLGRTPRHVLGVIDRILRRAAHTPLEVDGREVPAELVPGLLLTVDDTDSSYTAFAGLVRRLAAAADGTHAPASPLLTAKLELYSLAQPMPDLWFSATVANQCADRRAHRDPHWYREDVAAHVGPEPIFGALARHITPCAFWPTRPTESATRISVDHPVLIVGAAGDPVAPLHGQQAMHAALGGSTMVVLDGAFRHGVYPNAGSPCVADAVEQYLRDGQLPTRDLRCRAVAR